MNEDCSSKSKLSANEITIVIPSNLMFQCFNLLSLLPRPSYVIPPPLQTVPIPPFIPLLFYPFPSLFYPSPPPFPYLLSYSSLIHPTPSLPSSLPCPIPPYSPLSLHPLSSTPRCTSSYVPRATMWWRCSPFPMSREGQTLWRKLLRRMVSQSSSSHAGGPTFHRCVCVCVMVILYKTGGYGPWLF